MPKHLFFSCLIYLASRGAMAILAPLYETGDARVISPILMLLFIGTAICFMLRFAWAWRLMQWVAVTEIAVNALFFPAPKYFGSYTDLARVLVAVIIAACSIILWSLFRRLDTKSWFCAGPQAA